MRARISVLVACLALAAAGVWAHGGEEHVIGTVTQVTANTITVKTTAKAPVTVGVVPSNEVYNGQDGDEDRRSKGWEPRGHPCQGTQGRHARRGYRGILGREVAPTATGHTAAAKTPQSATSH